MAFPFDSVFKEKVEVLLYWVFEVKQLTSGYILFSFQKAKKRGVSVQTTFKNWLWSAGEYNIKTDPGVLLGKQFWKLSLISQI